MKELKKEYNQVVSRINKATEFFKNCTKEEVDKHLPLFLELNNKANDLLNELKKLGYRATLDEIERGFNLGKT